MMPEAICTGSLVENGLGTMEMVLDRFAALKRDFGRFGPERGGACADTPGNWRIAGRGG